MKRLSLVLISLLIFSLSSSGQIYQSDVTFMDSNGDMKSFEEQYGEKYLIVDAMFTTCGPCEVEMLHLQDVYDVIKDEPEVELISISAAPEIDSLNKVADFMDRFDAKWDYGLDVNEELNEQYNFTGFPTTLILSPEGEVLHRWLGITGSITILEAIDEHIELPGALARELNLQILIDNLLNSKFFYIFMIMFWIVIFYSGYNLIQKLTKPAKTDEVLDEDETTEPEIEA